MTASPFSIDRDVVICATRATVFRYFTDPERWALWWGKGSRLDPRPGGEVFIQYPNGQSAQGSVVEIDAPNRFVARRRRAADRHRCRRTRRGGSRGGPA
jgi:uncharacterized protein YndB with AHSA1/START domain